MTRVEAQKAFEEGWAIDASRESKWHRCIGVSPKDWEKPANFRYSSPHLKVENYKWVNPGFMKYKPYQKHDLKDLLC